MGKLKTLFVTIFAAFLIWTSLSLDEKAEASGIGIYVNDYYQSYSNLASVEKGTTLVPLRGIFEELGATVVYDAKSKTITATRGNKKVWLKIGSRTAKLNGKNVTLNVAPKVVRGNTLVPLRFISESLGATVQYDSRSRIVDIYLYTPNIISDPTDFYYTRDAYDDISYYFEAINTSGKTIKYITINMLTYNRVNDFSYDENTGEYFFSHKFIGPIYPGEGFYLENYLTQQGLLSKLKIDTIDVVYTDGKKASQKYNFYTDYEELID